MDGNGAIDVTIKNLTLREGATSLIGDDDYVDLSGGAIVQGEYVDEVNLILDSARFVDNDAEYAGGAIFLLEGSVEIIGRTVFSGNQARAGGAITVAQGNNNIDFEFPIVGPIPDYPNAVMISGNAAFLSNSATEDGGDGPLVSYGGAILIGEGSFAITGTATFTDNIAAGSGGAISSPIIYSAPDSTMDFEGNIAGENGGAIAGFLYGGYGPYGFGFSWLLGDANFDGNQAYGFGGAAAQWAFFGLGQSNLTFTNNSSGQNGGAIAAFGAIFGLNFYYGDGVSAGGSVIFDGNVAAGDGGAVNVEVFGKAAENEMIFTNNSAGLDGGGLWLSGSIYQSLSGLYFSNNQAINGGAIYSNDQVYITNSTFFENRASQEGGAVFARQDGSEATFSTFLDNTAAITGEDIPGQSIYTSGRFKLFGNIFANTLNDLPQLGEGIGGGTPEFVDLGGNMFNTSADSGEFNHPLSRYVSISELSIASSPSQDSRYPESTPVLSISPASLAVDAVDLNALTASIEQLARPLPQIDQRGVERTGIFDAGAYEAGVKEEIIVVAPKVVLPAAPTRISVKTMGKKTIRIDWALPTSAGTGKIVKYEVWRNGQKIATIDSNKRYFIDKGLDPNQSYAYRIVSVGTQGSSVKSTTSTAIYPKR